MKTISSRLKEARREHFATGVEAAKHYGWNRHTYRSNENGQRPPSRKALIKYARAFGVTLEWLMTGRGPRRATKSGQLRQVPIYNLDDMGDTKQTTLRALLLEKEPMGYAMIPDDPSLSADAFGVEIFDFGMVDDTRESLYPGDVLIVDPALTPSAGDTVLAQVGGRPLVRKVREDTETPETVRLAARNLDFRPSAPISLDDILATGYSVSRLLRRRP